MNRREFFGALVGLSSTPPAPRPTATLPVPIVAVTFETGELLSASRMNAFVGEINRAFALAAAERRNLEKSRS